MVVLFEDYVLPCLEGKLVLSNLVERRECKRLRYQNVLAWIALVEFVRSIVHLISEDPILLDLASPYSKIPRMFARSSALLGRSFLAQLVPYSSTPRWFEVVLHLQL